MPRAGVWLVRTALLQLVAGATIGALALGAKGMPVLAFAYRWLPLHVECLLLGWTLQLGFGVAYWILPRRPGGSRDGDRGRVWAAYALLNGGVLAAGVGAVVGPAWVPVAGRLAEVAAAALFAAHAWPRVRPYTPAAGSTPAA